MLKSIRKSSSDSKKGSSSPHIITRSVTLPPPIQPSDVMRAKNSDSNKTIVMGNSVDTLSNTTYLRTQYPVNSRATLDRMYRVDAINFNGQNQQLLQSPPKGKKMSVSGSSGETTTTRKGQQKERS